MPWNRDRKFEVHREAPSRGPASGADDSVPDRSARVSGIAEKSEQREAFPKLEAQPKYRAVWTNKPLPEPKAKLKQRVGSQQAVDDAVNTETASESDDPDKALRTDAAVPARGLVGVWGGKPQPQQILRASEPDKKTNNIFTPVPPSTPKPPVAY